MDDPTSAGMLRRLTFALPGESGTLAAIAFGDPSRPADLLFLHANGFNALTYRTILAPLGERRHVLAVDLRGHGRSTLAADPAGRRSWRDFRDDIVALLDTLSGPPMVLAGHSLGATCSVLAAAERPDRVRGLVLFDPVVMPRAAYWTLRLGASARLFRTLRDISDRAARRKATFPSEDAAIEAYTGRGPFKAWEPRELADYVADGFRATEDGAVELSCAPAWEASNFLSQAEDAWRALRRVRCPVHILKAEAGSTCALRQPLAPTMRIDVVPGTTHFLPVERPDAARAALDAA